MDLQGFDENDVVISGIGCKLPETDNLEEFTEKLLQGINLVTIYYPKLIKINFINFSPFFFFFFLQRFKWISFFFLSFPGKCAKF